MTTFIRAPKRALEIAAFTLSAILVACGGSAGHSTPAPTTASTAPVNASTGVAVDSAVVASFGEAVDPATINAGTFVVKQGAATVAGTVSYTGATATFRPAQLLSPGTSFAVTIAGAKYRDGTGLASNVVWTFVTSGTRPLLSPVLLGTSANYVILAETGISTVPPSVVTGDIAVSPAAESYVTGFALTDATGYATAPQVVGKVYAANQASPTPANLTSAINDMGTGYTDAAGRPNPDFVELATGAIGGMTLTPGLYKWGTGVGITSDVTLTGAATDVWIFQIAGALLQSAGGKVLLAGGAQAKNVFWQVAGGATLGTTSHFEGILLSQTAIVLQTGASMNGRALAQSAVTLDTSTVTQPGGANVPPADTTPPVVASASPAAGSTGIALIAAISATFSKPVAPSSLAFTVAAGGQPIAGSATVVGSVATFRPTAALPPSAVVTATIAGAKDLAGNALAASYRWSFTTSAAPDTTPPTVTATSPLADATAVSPRSSIRVTFNEAMAPASITQHSFTIIGPMGAAVSGLVSYDAQTWVATFQPASPFASDTHFTARVTGGAAGVADLDGNRLAYDFSWGFTSGVHINLAPVLLGTSGNYVILAESAITNSPASAITGDVAISPAAESYITGFSQTANTGYSTSPQVTGKIYAADQATPTPDNLTSAINDMVTAYTDAAGRPTPEYLELATGALGGLTLQPGLYKWTSTVTIDHDVSLVGNATDVWIFQISGDLTQASGARVSLSGGALPKNVFWQVAGAANLGTTSHFEGILLSKTAITLQTGASMNGRALAQTAVALDSNAVTKP